MKKRRVKRRLKVGRLVLVIVLGIGLAISTYFGIKYLLKSSNDKPINKPSEEEKEKVYTASVITAGDNLIHSSLYQDANKNANYSGYDFKPMYELIKPIVSNYDIKYYNQETILGGTELGLKSYPVFNSPYEVGDAMIDAGFNLVSLATNHTLDSGERAVLNSRNYWNSKSNVLAVGSYSSTEERNEVHILKKNNITYTMLNYTYGTNGIKVPTGKDYLVNVWPCTGNNPSTDTKYQEYKNKVKEDINRVRNKVDLLIVAMHWGVEYTHTPTSYQIDMANFLEKQGVDIIIGTHPHVVMPVTYINDTLVIYSLGNFLSAQETNIDYNTTVGLLSTVKITKHIDKDNNTSIKLSNQTNELIYTYSKNNKDYKVIPFSNPDIKTYLSDYERVYNKYASVIKNMDNTIEVNSIN